MSIEHKSTEGYKGNVDDDMIIKREGSRIVGVKGPTFIKEFYAPICQNRREMATMLAAQLAEQLASGEITMARVFELADEWIIEERRSAKSTMSMYFDLYMETDRTVEQAIEELERDFSLPSQ